MTITRKRLLIGFVVALALVVLVVWSLLKQPATNTVPVIPPALIIPDTPTTKPIDTSIDTSAAPITEETITPASSNLLPSDFYPAKQLVVGTDTQGQLVIVTTDTGASTGLFTPTPDQSVLYADFSGTGHYLLVTILDEAAEKQLVIDLETNQPRWLPEEIVQPTWLPSPAADLLLYFYNGRPWELTLATPDLTQHRAITTVKATVTGSSLRISPDSQTVAIISQPIATLPRQHVELINLTTGSTTALDINTTTLQWSPDSQSLLLWYPSEQQLALQLYRLADGTQHPLTATIAPTDVISQRDQQLILAAPDNQAGETAVAWTTLAINLADFSAVSSERAFTTEPFASVLYQAPTLLLEQDGRLSFVKLTDKIK